MFRASGIEGLGRFRPTYELKYSTMLSAQPQKPPHDMHPASLNPKPSNPKPSTASGGGVGGGAGLASQG